MLRIFTIALTLTGSLVLGGELEEKDRLEQSFSMAGIADPLLVIDNINGSINLEGYAGSEIQLIVNKTITAETKAKIEQAKREVNLDIIDLDGGVKFFVSTPYRKPDGEWRSHSDSGYTVRYDFTVRAPIKSRIEVSTVNSGKIEIKDIHGDFKVRNVNGGLALNGLGGSGSAKTVNGAVRATFDAYPEKDTDFKTINGDIEIRFPQNLSADLKFKTFNGEVFSDFEATLLPSDPPTQSQKGKVKRYKADVFTNFRIGGGGATLTFHTLNGDILIRSK